MYHLQGGHPAALQGRHKGEKLRWDPARQFARNTVAHSDHCSFPKEASALCSQHNSMLPSLLELYNFTQLRNCWLDLLQI